MDLILIITIQQFGQNYMSGEIFQMNIIYIQEAYYLLGEKVRKVDKLMEVIDDYNQLERGII